MNVTVDVLSLWDENTEEDLAAWHPLEPRVYTPRILGALGYAPELRKELDAGSPDLVHTHGLWTYSSLLAPRWSQRFQRPYLISPRGMLDSWALRNSAWKKRLAALLFENRHLGQASCLHALASSELDAMRRFGLRNPVCTIPNGVDLPKQTDGELALPNDLAKGRRMILFLGRLHPKKGLEQLLAAWSLVAGQSPQRQKQWLLVIAGWGSAGYESQLKAQCSALGLSESVHFYGPAFGEEKLALLQYARAFVLPSFSEGLPMAVLEAWAYGLPALITPQCNLSEVCSGDTAILAEPEPEDLARGLQQLLNMSDTERDAVGDRVRKLVASRFSWSTIAAQTKEVYQWLLGEQDAPACVRFHRDAQRDSV